MKNTQTPLIRLRHHVTGAIERGEAKPIQAVTDAGNAPRSELTGPRTVADVLEDVDKLVTEGGYTLYPERNAIRNPGRFEGEHVMTLYFYDAFMNGDGEPYSRGNENDLKFNISDAEAEAFDIEKGAQVILEFSEEGFVSSYINS